MTPMTTQDKLRYVEIGLQRTRTRVKRLQTLADRWEKRVKYYQSKLRTEQAFPKTQGRMFRRD